MGMRSTRIRGRARGVRRIGIGLLALAGAVLIAEPVAAGAVLPGFTQVEALATAPTVGALESDEPGPIWHPQDPADSLYRAARSALNQEEYRRAVELFREVRERYPSSAYSAETYYWEAFSLYRSGGGDNLRTALSRLQTLEDRFPEARSAREAQALATRVRGELARRGDAEAAERLAREATRERERDEGQTCASEEQDTRIAALNALLQMDAERAVPILRRVLETRDECSAELRRKAVFLLSQKAGTETADLLVEVARNDPDLEVREQAVFWLSQVPSEKAVAALEEIVRNHNETSVREKAIFALSQHSSDRAAQLLRDVAVQSDWPEELREKAIFWLGQHGSSQNGQFLRELYGRLDRTGLKERVIFSLAQRRESENREFLRGIALDDGEPIELRKKAIFWLGQSGGFSVPELADLYDGVTDRDIKQQIIFALSQRDEAAAVDVLMEIAQNEPDAELRKKALFWLGQSGDPRVAEFLLKLIEG